MTSALTLGVASWGIAGCDGGTSPELATVVVMVTDQPSEILQTAEVWISHIYLQSDDDEGGEADAGAAGVEGADAPEGRVDLFHAGPDLLARQRLDLLTLRDGVTAQVTEEVTVEAGIYHQLRFVVDSTWVVLKDGYAFEDRTTARGFKVPSGGRSGIKVDLIEGMLEAEAGESVTITVDFPVDGNFVIQQSRDPRVIRRILFTPNLNEKERVTAVS